MEKVLTTIKTKHRDGTYRVMQRLEGASEVENFYGIVNPASEFKDFKKQFKQCVKTRTISPNMILTTYTKYEGRLKVEYKTIVKTIVKDSKPRILDTFELMK